jgi:uncharacterized protein YnzC (UPF0291/DUF896 family)
VVIDLDSCLIDRINELARKAKTCGLNDEELAEQKALRDAYIQAFRNSLSQTLDNTYIERPDGSREKLQRKN